MCIGLFQRQNKSLDRSTLLSELTQVVKIFTEVRRKESFYSLSKGGNGPGAWSGVDTEGWGFESFNEFQGSRYGESGGFVSHLVHSSIQAGCFSIGCDFLENRLTAVRNFPALGCLKET